MKTVRMSHKKAIKDMYQDTYGFWIILKPEYAYGVDNTSIVIGETYRELCLKMKDVHKRDKK